MAQLVPLIVALPIRAGMVRDPYRTSTVAGCRSESGGVIVTVTGTPTSRVDTGALEAEAMEIWWLLVTAFAGT